MNKEITWVECDGGPHILIESKYLKIWKGETDAEFEQSKEYYELTRYIDDYIGELQIKSGKCIVLSEDIPSSTWLSDNNTSGFIVVINYVSDYYLDEEMKFDTLYNEFSKIPDEQFIDTNFIYQVMDEELYLLAACDFGSDWLYNYCKFNLLPGNYSIKMIEEYIFEDSSFRLFKFRKC
ncbi:MAG: immunity 21 family protein [Lachnospiraceae bacterium]|nr:immunity 21 family protein [Lachnospiraceae bacterium]